jgi:hypothetical protein
LPLKTQQFGYDTELLGEEVVKAYRRCGALARRTNTRVAFHPD